MSRSYYPVWCVLPTRWMDNDIYGHINNATYYSLFDTVINAHLISAGGLDIEAGPVIGLAVETGCKFHAALAFPDVIDAGLRVGHLGRTSVRYEVALHSQGAEDPAAEGHFVHVFVERETRRPIEIPAQLRACLERLIPPA